MNTIHKSIRLLSDENFNGHILRGLLRLLPDLDIVRVQDTPLASASDPEILEWTAKEGRILLTHDVSTVTHFAYERMRAGQPMPGVVEVSTSMAIGRAIEEIQLLVEAGVPEDFENQVWYLTA